MCGGMALIPLMMSVRILFMLVSYLQCNLASCRSCQFPRMLFPGRGGRFFPFAFELEEFVIVWHCVSFVGWVERSRAAVRSRPPRGECDDDVYACN